MLWLQKDSLVILFIIWYAQLAQQAVVIKLKYYSS